MTRALEQLLQFPPNKLWRLLVYNPEPGKDLYQQFNEEPGSLQGMINGLNFVIRTWHAPLTLDYITDLHDITVEGVYTVHYGESKEGKVIQQQILDKGLRNGYTVSFNLIANVNLSHQGTGDLLTRLEKGVNYFSISAVNQPNKIKILPGTTIDKKLTSHYFNIFSSEPHEITTEKNINVIQYSMQQAINDFLQMINYDEDKLYYIAYFLHELELIHGFGDANCRTYGVLLLIKLLIQYDLPLGFLQDPNVLDGFSPMEIKSKILYGSQLVAQLLENPFCDNNNFPNHCNIRIAHTNALCPIL
jgi:hypothetical protein